MRPTQWLKSVVQTRDSIQRGALSPPIMVNAMKRSSSIRNEFKSKLLAW
jgi:hypothetical protein